ncbi:MAG: adenylate/guanylate cyclase domain-containing protein [Reyranellaceae bacterium]
MTASTAAARLGGGVPIIRHYYYAMAVPFVIDLITLVVYAGINRAPYFLPVPLAISAAFLLLGVGLGAQFLIRPVRRFLDGDVDFRAIEESISGLPRRSCALMAAFYAPMLALRLFARRFDIGFGGMLEHTAWIDGIASFIVGTGFTVLLTFFMVSAYLDELCEFLFRSRGVNLSVFHGKFRRKIGFALLFVAFAAMILLASDILSYEGPRLLREAAMDIVGSVTGTVFIYFWISRALTRPIVRLDHGMHRVGQDDYGVRLPVTSDDEMGHAVSQFNAMVEGLSEREYLRDTFGKYVSPSVAQAILDGRTGRAGDRTEEATLMFTDIEGFTAFSERLPPAEVARLLNTYLAAIVPVIERHGGVVNSFIGDGLFASFNLPLPLADHAAAALQAARDIQATLDSLPDYTKLGLRTRIGINTGTVIGVTIGAENRLNYTLLGDAVNVAARLEQLNKQFDTLILATESTVRAAGMPPDCSRIGDTDIRGHQGNVMVYRVGVT